MGLCQINGPVIMDIPADPCSLFLVRCIVERLAQRLEFTQEEVQHTVLAVDEACSNVIRHAYHGRTNERIVLTFNVREDRLEILVRDLGTPVDPSTFTCRDLDDIRPGGLGIHFIKCAMDKVEYEMPQEGGMLLKMTKLRTRGKTGDS